MEDTALVLYNKITVELIARESLFDRFINNIITVSIDIK